MIIITTWHGEDTITHCFFIAKQDCLIIMKALPCRVMKFFEEQKQVEQIIVIA